MKSITIRWLQKQNACDEGIYYFETLDATDPVVIIQSLIDHQEHLNWANWLIVRIMSPAQRQGYTNFAVEQAIRLTLEKYSEPGFATWAAKWLSGRFYALRAHARPRTDP